MPPRRALSSHARPRRIIRCIISAYGGLVRMKRIARTLQVAFTYIGTVVGAGFATGREILQFFTQYGWTAVFAILVSTALFIWLGTKMMTTASHIKARSYEDLNIHLFGPVYGRWVSLFMLVILLGVNTVMLAGAGSVFHEHLNLSYQSGLLITLFLAFFLIRRGMSAILAVNSIVVPIMLLFTIILAMKTMDSPASSHWIYVSNELSPIRLWISPFLYAAFNLALAQAVLVPLGAEIGDRKVLSVGGWLGGIGIGFMLVAGHYILLSHMPGVRQYEIPMAGIAHQLGHAIWLIYVFLIFAEIFTTFIADVYGLTLQLEQRLQAPRSLLLFFILLFCYAVSQAGFSTLLGILYPLFGIISLIWMYRMARRTPTSKVAR